MDESCCALHQQLIFRRTNTLPKSLNNQEKAGARFLGMQCHRQNNCQRRAVKSKSDASRPALLPPRDRKAGVYYLAPANLEKKKEKKFCRNRSGFCSPVDTHSCIRKGSKWPPLYYSAMATPEVPKTCKVVMAETIAKSLLSEVKQTLQGVRGLDHDQPCLVAFLANEDPAAVKYAEWSKKTCEEKYASFSPSSA